MWKPNRPGRGTRRGRTANRLGAAAAALIAASGLLAAERVAPGEALAWAAVAGAVTAGELAYVHRQLGAVSDAPGEPLGVANGLTLVRGGLFAAVAGFVTVSPSSVPWGPALCYGVGVALDAADGWVARAAGRPTRLGERLDLAFDTFGFVAAPVVAVAWGQLPVWYLALSAARYVFRAAVGWRRRRGRPVHDLPTSRVRRPLAALQMGLIAVALTPVVGLAAIRLPAALALSASLGVFLRDYLAVTGRLPAHGTAG